jgi:preprotein translocase subunit SecG
MLVFVALMAMAVVIILAFMLESGHAQFEKFEGGGDNEGLFSRREKETP